MKNTLKIEDGKINFCCKINHCKHSCCGPFSGISTELSNIDNRKFEEIVLTDEDVRLLCDNGRSDLIEEGFSNLMNKKYHKMALENDGTCKAFINGKCSIHDISPTLCKAFPFYFDMFSGLCAISCDGFCEECQTDLKNFEANFEAAKKMYSFWLDFYTPKKPENQ